MDRAEAALALCLAAVFATVGAKTDYGSRGEQKMTLRNALLLTISLCLMLLISANESAGPSSPTFMQLSRAKSALYKSDSGPAPHVGIVMHHESNYLRTQCGLPNGLMSDPDFMNSR